MMWLVALYVAIAWLIAVEVMRTAVRRADVVRGLVEALLWPAVIVLANLGLVVDAVRTRPRWGRRPL